MIINHNCYIKLVPLVIFIYDAQSHIHQIVCECVCVCKRERERLRERETENDNLHWISGMLNTV